MKKDLDRRSFIKAGATLSAATLIGGAVNPSLLYGAEKVDLAVVEGRNYFKSTVKAVNLLGGMKKFVSNGATVGLLVNTWFNKRGAYVNPDITLAIARMCYEAGASKIFCLQTIKGSYWKRGQQGRKYRGLVSTLKNIEASHVRAVYDPVNFSKVKVPGGIIIKELEVVKTFLECDTYINVAISKHHSSARYTGVLKNTMGICTRASNITFHKDYLINKRWDNDANHLAQAIADLNLLRKPNLCVLDSTEFLVTNGPSGPGKIVKLNKVITGSDIVAVDSFFGSLRGHKIGEILTIKKADEHGIGEIDYRKLRISEARV